MNSRDDFSRLTKELLARRVAHRCSNPTCRKPTSGPESDGGAVNLGVAGHITAAAPGGPRYDPNLSAEDRRSATNGIWLCQNCGKLVDSDEPWYSEPRLRAWKAEAEEVARIELEMRMPAPSGLATRFARLEGLMSDLLAEMRTDLTGSPTFREFVLLRRSWSFWNGGQTLAYYYEEHPNLDSQVRILWNEGFITDISSANVKRFVISEDLVDYLNTSPGR